jgi:hypothetical protein
LSNSNILPIYSNFGSFYQTEKLLDFSKEFLHLFHIFTEAIVFLPLYMNKSCVFNRAREKLEIYIANSQFYDLWNNSFKEVISFCIIRMEKYDTCIKFRALEQNKLERNK